MSSLRIEAGQLIPGRGEPIDDGAVVVDNGTITYAGPAAGAPPADLAVRVPTLLPGLWECHGHFTGMAVPDIVHEIIEPLAARAARATADVTATLMGGVTSVREVGGLGLEIRRVVDEGTVTGPSIYSAGSILSTTGGHADVHSLPLDWVVGADHRIGALCDGVAECLKAVRANLRRGADIIKICASGGVFSEVDHPIHQQFSGTELRAIVEEAGRAERVVAAHCHGKPGIMAALEAGVATIEHGSYLDEEAAQAMVESGAILVPTRFVVDDLLNRRDELPPYALRKLQMIAGHHEHAMKVAVAAGVRIATGTDIFASGTSYGMNSGEIRHLVDAGLTPLQAIEAATANGPSTLGPQAPRSGQLVEGYDADLIALDFDPLVDPSRWGDPDRVTHVWKAGIMVKAP